MSSEFKQEEGYIVFKLGDLHRYCPDFNISSIERVWQIIAEGRALEGKRPFSAVVIENDLPENEPIWKAIEARVTGAQPAPSVPVAALRPVIDWLRNGCEPQEAAKELELLIGVAPEAKP